MFRRLRERRAAARRDALVMERAAVAFRRQRGIEPMGAFIIRRDDEAIIVRVMFLTTHVPPDRAWYRVSLTSDDVLELTAEDAADPAVWR